MSIKIVKDNPKRMEIGDLDVGRTFVYMNELFILSSFVSHTEVYALNLNSNGVKCKFKSNTEVDPVDIEIKIV